MCTSRGGSGGGTGFGWLVHAFNNNEHASALNSFRIYSSFSPGHHTFVLALVGLSQVAFAICAVVMPCSSSLSTSSVLRLPLECFTVNPACFTPCCSAPNSPFFSNSSVISFLRRSFAAFATFSASCILAYASSLTCSTLLSAGFSLTSVVVVVVVVSVWAISILVQLCVEIRLSHLPSAPDDLVNDPLRHVTFVRDEGKRLLERLVHVQGHARDGHASKHEFQPALLRALLKLERIEHEVDAAANAGMLHIVVCRAHVLERVTDDHAYGDLTHVWDLLGEGSRSEQELRLEQTRNRIPFRCRTAHRAFRSAQLRRGAGRSRLRAAPLQLSEREAKAIYSDNSMHAIS